MIHISVQKCTSEEWLSKVARAGRDLSGGIGSTTAHRILARHKLTPHRMLQYKVSTDPDFAEKTRAVRGLYTALLDRAVVLSIDENL